MICMPMGRDSSAENDHFAACSAPCSRYACRPFWWPPAAFPQKSCWMICGVLWSVKPWRSDENPQGTSVPDALSEAWLQASFWRRIAIGYNLIISNHELLDCYLMLFDFLALLVGLPAHAGGWFHCLHLLASDCIHCSGFADSKATANQQSLSTRNNFSHGWRRGAMARDQQMTCVPWWSCHYQFFPLLLYTVHRCVMV